MLWRLFKSFVGIIWGVIKIIFKPFWMIIAGTWHLLEQFAELFAWIADIPTKIKNMIPDAKNSVGEKITAVSESGRERKDRKKRTKVAAALGNEVSELILSEDYLRVERNSKIVKWILIGILQLISVFTTYRGLYQCFSQFGVYIPLGFTIVIQFSVFYFSGTISQRHGHRFRGVLLAAFLLASLTMSYIGITENLLPYNEYVEERYEKFNEIFDDEQYALSKAQLEDSTVTSADDVTAEVERQWANIQFIYNAASKEFTEEGLEKLKATQDGMQNQTQTITVERIDGYDPEHGYYGRGDSTETTPDTEAQKLAQGMNDSIQAYTSNLLKVESLSGLAEFDGDSTNDTTDSTDDTTDKTIDSDKSTKTTLEKIKDAVTKQFGENHQAISSEYRKIAGKIDIIQSDCNALAEAMGITRRVDLDLQTLWADYCGNNAVSELTDMSSFDDVVNEWKKSGPIPEGSGTLQTFLNEHVVSALPTDLKHAAESKVDDSYQALRQTLYALDKSTKKLDDAYEEFRLVHPFVYAFSALGSSFGTAIIAVIIALFNDCSAVAIGLFISPSHPNWLTDKTFTQKELVPYNYIQFKSVILTCIAKHFRDTDERPTKQSIYQKFSETILEFLDKFSVSGLLVAEGFGRYALAKKLDSSMETKLLSFMQYFDIARLIKASDAKNLGFDVNPDDGEIVLLKCRAELWLMDILGTASESQIFGDIPDEISERADRVVQAGQASEQADQKGKEPLEV